MYVLGGAFGQPAHLTQCSVHFVNFVCAQHLVIHAILHEEDCGLLIRIRITSRRTENITDLYTGDGWAVSGFGEISRWAKGVFRILKRPSPFQDLQIARTFLRLPKGIFTMKPLLIIYAVVEAVQKTLLENILRLPRKFSRLPRGIFRIEALVNDCLQATTHSLTHCCA